MSYQPMSLIHWQSPLNTMTPDKFFPICVFGLQLTFFGTRFGKISFCGDISVSAPSKAVVSQLDNPAWPKVSHQARTELNVYQGNEMHKA